MTKPQEYLKLAYEKLKSARGQIKEAYEDMVIRLAVAAEYKDPSTGGHIRRVGDYSAAIAKSLGLPEEEVSVIRYASMMHDIGKIGIPESILDKKGPLTADERREMNKHTQIGYSIFKGSKFPLVEASAQIALSHHEKYDGTGYPKGLKGDNIPLYGRIVSVADYFDAFVSERCYKSANSFEDAILELEHKASTFFDPKVVIAFLKVKDTVKKILNANLVIEDFVKNGKAE